MTPAQLAFSADAKGSNSKTVAMLYLQAMAQSPLSEQLICNYCCYFVVIASMRRAKLLYRQYSKDFSTASKLELVRTLAARGEVTFAREVLGSSVEHSPAIDFARQFVEHLRLAQDEYSIFPGYLNPFTAWGQVHLHQQPVVRSHCGRVSYIQDDVYGIVYGDRKDGRNVYMLMSWPKDATELQLQENDLVELAELPNKKLSLLRFEQREWDPEGLMEPALYTARYLRFGRHQ